MEGVISEVLLEEVVGIDISIANDATDSPKKIGVFACSSG